MQRGVSRLHAALNIGGDDSKFSCNLAHGLYSWMGAAAEGGYLGADAQSFFSAVVSGAAGSYILTLTSDAGISTDLQIQPGQDVHVSGAGVSPPSWGGGGFVVQQGGSLSLTGVVLTGSASVLRDGMLHLNEVVFAGRSYNFYVAEGAVFTRQGGADPLDQQCHQPFTTLTDGWRSTDTGSGDHADRSSGTAYDTGVGGSRWYRFEGAGGDALPLSSPGHNHCGTGDAGWLSGWTGANTPPNNYGGTGRYPSAAEGVVEMTVCFDGHNGCDGHMVVGVLRCGSFLLWQLPDAPGGGAYCTASSGL